MSYCTYAQELYRRNGRCETIRYEGGAIIIDNGEPVVPGGKRREEGLRSRKGRRVEG